MVHCIIVACTMSYSYNVASLDEHILSHSVICLLYQHFITLFASLYYLLCLTITVTHCHCDSKLHYIIPCTLIVNYLVITVRYTFSKMLPSIYKFLFHNQKGEKCHEPKLLRPDPKSPMTHSLG